MKHIGIIVDVDGDLSTELSSGFVSLSVARARLGHPTRVILWDKQGTGLRIESQMHDVAQRTEVGVLRFSRADESNIRSGEVKLPEEFALKTWPFLLTITESGVTAESGLVLKGALGGEVIVVAGAFPGTLTILGSTVAEPFDPEYALSAYNRSALNPAK